MNKGTPEVGRFHGTKLDDGLIRHLLDYLDDKSWE